VDASSSDLEVSHKELIEQLFTVKADKVLNDNFLEVITDDVKKKIQIGDTI
jgi:hypothetical protein